jgi:hypothetical protein
VRLTGGARLERVRILAWPCQDLASPALQSCQAHEDKGVVLRQNRSPRTRCWCWRINGVVLVLVRK